MSCCRVLNPTTCVALFAVFAAQCAFSETRRHILEIADAEGAAAAAAVDAYEFVGPDTAAVKAPCDITLNNVSVAADTGVVALYEPCLMTTNTLIWKNVSLADVTAFSAQMGGSGVGSTWRNPGFVGNMSTNASTGAITVQFQYKNGRPLYMMAVTFTQSGDDVVAKVSNSVYQYDRGYGSDFSGYGSSRTVTNTVNGSFLAIRRLGCTLKDEAVQAPVKVLALRNASSGGEDANVTATYAKCLVKSNVVLWPDTDFSKIDYSSVSAQMAGLEIGTTWRTSPIYCITTNADSSISGQFQYKANGTVYSAEVTFKQSGADVYAYISRFVKQYGAAIGENLGTGQRGVAVNVTNELSSAACALRNITGTWSRPYNYAYGTRCPNCITNVAATVWKDVQLSEVENFAARIGGSAVSSTWRFAEAYRPVTNSVLNQITVQFQWRNGYTTSSARNHLVQVRFTQSGRDVLAEVIRTSYQYTTAIGTDISGVGEVVSCVDKVDGNGLAIKDITCTRIGCGTRMTANVNGLSTGAAAVELRDMDLEISEGSGMAGVMPSSVVGRGTVKANRAIVTNDCSIASDGGIATVEGGALVFDIDEAAGGAVPAVTASAAAFASGSDIVLTGDVAFSDALLNTPITLVAGGGLSDGDIQGLKLSFEGALGGRYKGKLAVVDGDLVVTVREARGICVLIY